VRWVLTYSLGLLMNLSVFADLQEKLSFVHHEWTSVLSRTIALVCGGLASMVSVLGFPHGVPLIL
jgi:hypothetical protein